MIVSICNLSVVPVRSAKGHKKEMITQLLLGELVEVWEKSGEWSKIRCLWDNQIGWVESNQLRLPATTFYLLRWAQHCLILMG